jgi:NADH dehydrogenase FAD-containing subunit
MQKTRVLILGGGFGGLYAALEFEKRREPDIEVTLISEENFFLFTPMLHEVAASDLDLTHIVNPIRRMLRHVRFLLGKFSLSIFWNDQSSLLTVSTSTRIRSNMTTSYSLSVA